MVDSNQSADDALWSLVHKGLLQVSWNPEKQEWEFWIESNE